MFILVRPIICSLSNSQLACLYSLFYYFAYAFLALFVAIRRFFVSLQKLVTFIKPLH